MRFWSRQSRYHLHVKVFMWGCKVQLRWKYTWYHAKLTAQRQYGWRADSRANPRKKTQGRKPTANRNYVTTLHVRLGFWSSRKGKSNLAKRFGMMVYWPNNQKRRRPAKTGRRHSD